MLLRLSLPRLGNDNQGFNCRLKRLLLARRSAGQVVVQDKLYLHLLMRPTHPFVKRVTHYSSEPLSLILGRCSKRRSCWKYATRLTGGGVDLTLEWTTVGR
jgi:hypothetical protein